MNYFKDVVLHYDGEWSLILADKKLGCNVSAYKGEMILEL